MSAEDPSEKGNGTAGGAPESSGLPVAESPEEQIASLTARLDQVDAERRDLHDRHLRAVAELENYKKRVRREQTEAARYAAEPLIRDLLPVLDNLERAVEHAGGANGASLVEGVALVLKALQDLLRQHGVKTIEPPVGEPFDPRLHEAVDRREGDGDPNRVAQLWQRGYQLHDRLLRPARVVVSAPRASCAVANGNDDD
jgi:molecular chaperone GrpE